MRRKHNEMRSYAFTALVAAVATCAAFAKPVKVGNPGFPYSVPGSFLTVSVQEKGKYLPELQLGNYVRKG